MVWNNILFVGFGAIVGSFLNVCIVRLPKSESIVQPRSHCVSCNNSLAFYDLIPLLSFLWLRGRCRHCHKTISIEYFIVEALTALLALWTFSLFGFTSQGLSYFAFAAALVVVTFIDIHHRIIPDSISLGGIVVGLALSFLTLQITPLASLLGVLMGGGILLLLGTLYFKLTKKEGMGGGDVKLTAMLGAFLGYQSIFLILFISSILGVIWGIGAMLIQKKDLQYALPFGPFLALAAMITLFYGDPILLLLGYY